MMNPDVKGEPSPCELVDPWALCIYRTMETNDINCESCLCGLIDLGITCTIWGACNQGGGLNIRTRGVLRIDTPSHKSKFSEKNKWKLAGVSTSIKIYTEGSSHKNDSSHD